VCNSSDSDMMRFVGLFVLKIFVIHGEDLSRNHEALTNLSCPNETMGASILQTGFKKDNIGIEVMGKRGSSTNRVALPFKHGDHVRLRQHLHGSAYLGMCDSGSGCSGSAHSVYGYTKGKGQGQTIWRVERHGTGWSFKENKAKSYIGTCGYAPGCDNALYSLFGYSSKNSRTTWEVTTASANRVYLRELSHGTYAGMCGHYTCGGSSYGVFAYRASSTRTQWEVELVNPPPQDRSKITEAGTSLTSKKVADLNKREGLLYDLASKISEMCTITPEDAARPDYARQKNQICNYVPKLVIGNYKGGEVTGKLDSDNLEDQEDTGCKDLPLAKDELFFVFGISLPTVEPVFDGGNLCFVLLLDKNGSPEAGTGLLLFAPKLFTGNPFVKNINVPVPGTGEAINAAAALVTYVAVGVSFRSNPAMEVEFSNDFWRCKGECKTVKANLYAAIKLDATAHVAKKIKLGDLTVAIEAKCLIDFDPARDGFMSQFGGVISDTVKKINEGQGLQELINPDLALKFLMAVLQNDIALGIDGKITIGIPLGDWSNGLLRDLDITVGAASMMLRKTQHCTTLKVIESVTWAWPPVIKWKDVQLCTPETGLWGTLTLGGHANDLMSDIQSKIIDKFNSGPLKACVGLLGKGVEMIVNALQSIGLTFQIYFTANCGFTSFDALCSGFAFGFMFKASLFEAYIEKDTDGKVAVCFAFKSIFDSCGNGFENILLMLKAIGEVVLKVVTAIADAVKKAFHAVGKFVADLGAAALEAGKIAIDAIGEGFEKGAAQVAVWASEVGDAVVEFAGDAVAAVDKALTDMGAAVSGAIVDGVFIIGAAASDVAEWTAGAANDVADWTVGAANDVADWTVGAANDVAYTTEVVANDVADWTVGAANDVANVAEDAWSVVSSFR